MRGVTYLRLRPSLVFSDAQSWDSSNGDSAGSVSLRCSACLVARAHVGLCRRPDRSPLWPAPGPLWPAPGLGGEGPLRCCAGSNAAGAHVIIAGSHVTVARTHMIARLLRRRRSTEDAVELKAGQSVLVSTAPGAKFSRECIPLSISSFQGCNLKPGSEIFVGQYLFAGAPHAVVQGGATCRTWALVSLGL